MGARKPPYPPDTPSGDHFVDNVLPLRRVAGSSALDEPDFDTPAYQSAEKRVLARKRTGARATRMLEEREHLRGLIRTLWHMEEVYRILQSDWRGQVIQVYNEETGRMEPNKHGRREPDRIAEYRGKLEHHQRMIDKVMPSLKPISHEEAMDRADEDYIDQAHAAGPPQVRVIAFRPPKDANGVEDPDKVEVLRTVNPQGGREVDTPLDTPLDTSEPDSQPDLDPQPAPGSSDLPYWLT